MDFGKLKEIIGKLSALGIADDVPVKILMVNGEKAQLRQYAFRVEGQDADYDLDASNHFAAQVLQPAVVLLKQD